MTLEKEKKKKTPSVKRYLLIIAPWKARRKAKGILKAEGGGQKNHCLPIEIKTS